MRRSVHGYMFGNAAELDAVPHPHLEGQQYAMFAQLFDTYRRTEGPEQPEKKREVPVVYKNGAQLSLF